MMMKRQIYGINKSVCLKSAYSVEEWPIIFGPWAYLVHAVRVRKFITIAVLFTVKKEARSQMRIGILKYGIWSSCRTSEEKAAVKMLFRF